MEVHTLKVNKEERSWARLNKSKFTAITHTQTYLFKVFIVLFMKLLIYISTDWTFTTAVNTPHFNSLWVYTVSFHLLSVKSPVSFCTPVAFFLLSLAAKLHIYLCKCNFYEKVFLYEENQKFCNDFYQHKTHREECHPWQKGGTPGW